MSDDDVVLADQQRAARITPIQWAPLSLLAGLIAISALIDAVALIADIVRTSASLRQALQPVVVSSAGPAGGGTSNAEAMKSMGFDHFVRHWLMNMDIPLQLLLYVLVACWVYQAVYNVNARGATGVGKPGWVMAWFMMPVVNLVSPAFYMSRIWRASIDVRDWEQRGAPALLWIWWLAWVALCALSWTSTRRSRERDSPLQNDHRGRSGLVAVPGAACHRHLPRQPGPATPIRALGPRHGLFWASRQPRFWHTPPHPLQWRA